MKAKTYGINGLIEWHGIVEAGAIKMKVSFTGGGASSFGVAPATFTSKDELTQYVIEHSKQWRDGKIKLVRQWDIPDNAATIARKAMEAAEAPAPVVETPAEPAPVVEETSEESTEEGEAVVNENAETITVDVASKADAIEWLKEHYPEKGYTASKLTRTNKAFVEACEECNVKFNIAQ